MKNEDIKLLTFRVFRLDGGCLLSTNQSFRWNSEKQVADRVPSSDNTNGFYSVEIKEPSDHFKNLLIASNAGAIVENSGQIVIHEDGIVRAEKCRIVMLFIRQNIVTIEQTKEIKAKYCVPIVYTDDIYKSVAKWREANRKLLARQIKFIKNAKDIRQKDAVNLTAIEGIAIENYQNNVKSGHKKLYIWLTAVIAFELLVFSIFTIFWSPKLYTIEKVSLNVEQLRELSQFPEIVLTSITTSGENFVVSSHGESYNDIPPFTTKVETNYGGRNLVTIMGLLVCAFSAFFVFYQELGNV